MGLASWTIVGAIEPIHQAFRIYINFCSSSKIVPRKNCSNNYIIELPESQNSCFLPFFDALFLTQNTESQFLDVWSILAYFTILGALKFMYRAIRICINIWASSLQWGTRALRKRVPKRFESEEVYSNSRSLPCRQTWIWYWLMMFAWSQTLCEWMGGLRCFETPMKLE